METIAWPHRLCRIVASIVPALAVTYVALPAFNIRDGYHFPSTRWRLYGSSHGYRDPGNEKW